MSPMLVTILLGVAVMLVLAVTMGWVLGWANVAFRVEVDPKITQIAEILPGANCGACGFAGCNEYATQLAEGTAAPGACTQCSADKNAAIAEVLGVAAGDSFPNRAVVHCSAHLAQRLGQTEYAGAATCAAANLVPGVQGCTYGCLGLGDCMRVCPEGAISIGDGLCTIDYTKCVGCKKCVAVCPRKIISVIPFKTTRTLVVACSNHDMGPDVKSVCSVGCLGCTACSRRDGAFVMQGNLPVLDYDTFACDASHTVVVEKCPSGILVFIDDAIPDEGVTDIVMAGDNK